MLAVICIYMQSTKEFSCIFLWLGSFTLLAKDMESLFCREVSTTFLLYKSETQEGIFISWTSSPIAVQISNSFSVSLVAPL